MRQSLIDSLTTSPRFDQNEEDCDKMSLFRNSKVLEKALLQLLQEGFITVDDLTERPNGISLVIRIYLSVAAAVSSAIQGCRRPW